MLSISKLTTDFSLYVTFNNNFFIVQNRQMGRVEATSKRDGGLYVLECGNSTFLCVLKNKYFYASFDLWYASIEHVNHLVISYLNKKCHLYLTSLLHSPYLCSICRLAKNYHLPYSFNDHRLSHVLDLIHCDLWDPSPIK